ncbi:MAG TPA: ATP-binding cassette domain-containing protein [Polyangiaceae bacterium]|nr:ATP-binding cassette domain-containing protein [Polyangiaceae bacterium]
MTPILEVQNLKKIYTRGFVSRKQTFTLNANFSVPEAQIVGVMGPNGSGKTTLFELLSGSNIPTSGKVVCSGQDIHQVKYRERDRMVIHYHQSYQVRSVKKTVPSFMLRPAPSSYPMVHVFDEPQFSTQDGYIGFMLDFFKHLRASGRVVFLCVHPNEPFHVDIMRDNCERYLFVSKGQVVESPTWDTLLYQTGVRDYLGALADC